MTTPTCLGFLTGPPGPGELILLFVVVLVLFGPKRLPEIARMLGRTMDELRRASRDFRDQIMEIGDGQRSAVEDLFLATPAFHSVSFRADAAGVDRVVTAVRGRIDG